MAYDSSSPDFARFAKRFENNVQAWFEKLLEALSLYITLDDELIKGQIIIDIIYVIGKCGMVKYYQSDKNVMICRMLYRMLGIKLNEEKEQ